MCYLIHLGVPRSHAQDVPAGRVPRVEPQENPSISAAFGPAFALFSIADGGCSCSLYTAPDPARAERDALAKRRKYERLGWSPAKIERALVASGQSRSETPRRSGIRHDIATLIGQIARMASEVRLLVHAHHGAFREEIIVPQSTRLLNVEELEASAHATVAVDVVYSIVATGAA